MKFGLICEGITDFSVLKNIIDGVFEEVDVQPRIRELQPLLDVHTNKQENFGGWEQVAEYLKSDRFEDAVVNHDYIVVQIDTDVSNHPNFNACCPSLADKDQTVFLDEIKAKMIEWVDSFEADTYDFYKEKIVFCICIHSLECWVLLIHGDDKQRNQIKSCTRRLVQVNKRKNIGFIEKDADSYDHISKKFKKDKNLVGFRGVSYSFDAFVDQLIAIRDGVGLKTSVSVASPTSDHQH